MNKTKIAEELMDLVPDFAKALDKVNFGSNLNNRYNHVDLISKWLKR